jgi:hypothetical protein
VTAIASPDAASKNAEAPRNPPSPARHARDRRARSVVGPSPPARHARMEQ